MRQRFRSHHARIKRIVPCSCACGLLICVATLGALYYESQPDKLASGFGERSERLGVWGEVLPNRSVFPVSVGVQGANWECFLRGIVPGRKWVTVGIDSALVRNIGVETGRQIPGLLGLNK